MLLYECRYLLYPIMNLILLKWLFNYSYVLLEIVFPHQQSMAIVGIGKHNHIIPIHMPVQSKKLLIK